MELVWDGDERKAGKGTDWQAEDLFCPKIPSNRRQYFSSINGWQLFQAVAPEENTTHTFRSEGSVYFWENEYNLVTPVCLQILSAHWPVNKTFQGKFLHIFNIHNPNSTTYTKLPDWDSFKHTHAHLYIHILTHTTYFVQVRNLLS